MSKQEVIKQIEAECCRIEEDTKLTAKSQYNAASTLRYYQTSLAIIATVAATGAGFSAIKTYSWGSVVIIAGSFLSAIITAVLSTLKPLEKAGVYHQFGVDFQQLCDDTRIFRTVMLPADDITEEQLTDKLQELSDRRTKLRSEAPQHSYSAFLKANKGVQQGQSTYEVDKSQ